MKPLLARPAFLPARLLALACAPACRADGSAYAGVGALARHYDLSQPGAADDSASGTSLSGRWIAGYDFDRHWGVELGYVDLGKPAVASAGGSRLSTRGHAWFGAVKASLPLSEKSAVFVKAGVDRHRWEVMGSGPAPSLNRRATDTSLYLGAGLKYRLSGNLAATFEIERFGAAEHPGGPLAGASLNLLFRF